MSDTTHFDNLRHDEEQARHEQQVNAAFAEREGDGAVAQEQWAEGQEPGHLANDTSAMTLLQTDLDQLAQAEHEPNEEVRQALEDLSQLDIRERIEEADA